LLPIGILVGVLLVVLLRPPAPRPADPLPPTNVSILLPAGAPPELSWFRSFELSPDGMTLVYTAHVDGRRQLYMRRMDRPDAIPIPGTNGGYGPFFSADGTQIGFYVAGRLQRVAVAGGEPVTLYEDASDPMGAAWATDGTLVFSRRLLEGLHWMPPGEKARYLTTLREEQGERSHFWPHFLPDGRHLLFTVWRGGGIRHGHVDLLDLQTGERRTLIPRASTARYVDGHLLFARTGRLMQVPFDVERLEITGAESLLVEDLSTHAATGAAHFAIATNGTIVYASTDAFAIGRMLSWIDRDGSVEAFSSDLRPYATPQLSPDDSRLALTIGATGAQIWLADVRRGDVERLTRDGYNIDPVWTPDGKRIAFSSERAGPYNIYWQAARADADPERLTTNANMQFPGSWTPDGRWLAYAEFHPKTRWDIWLLPVAGDRKPEPFLVTEFDEFLPTFSPEGRLVAYVSNESGKWDTTGRWEVYLRTREDPETRVRVSTRGGSDPCWSADGSELYYRVADRFEAVTVASWPDRDLGTPRVVHTGVPLPEIIEPTPTYDIARDGRILTVQLGEPAQPTALTLLLGGAER
jgi:serine/threonine-protein kinase